MESNESIVCRLTESLDKGNAQRLGLVKGASVNIRDLGMAYCPFQEGWTRIKSDPSS